MGMMQKNLEVTDPEEIRNLVEACRCCRLGFNDHGRIYIVPMNFGYEVKDGNYVFYFHGARSGRKYGLLQEKPEVGFEMDADTVLVPGRTAAECTYAYRSIIGTGRAELIEDMPAKMAAVQQLMLHYRGRTGWEIPEKMLAMTAVFKVTVTEMSCRYKGKPE